MTSVLLFLFVRNRPTSDCVLIWLKLMIEGKLQKKGEGKSKSEGREKSLIDFSQFPLLWTTHLIFFILLFDFSGTKVRKIRNCWSYEFVEAKINYWIPWIRDEKSYRCERKIFFAIVDLRNVFLTLCYIAHIHTAS